MMIQWLQPSGVILHSILCEPDLVRAALAGDNNGVTKGRVVCGCDALGRPIIPQGTRAWRHHAEKEWRPLHTLAPTWRQATDLAGLLA